MHIPNITGLGQVFTRASTVAKMLKLRANKGSVLEPSCGDGAFLQQIPEAFGIECDASVCPADALNMDFFAYPTRNKFATIIGNPPFVRYNSIEAATKDLLPGKPMFNQRANLYLFFIHKCVQHLSQNGELIFITPRSFLQSSAAFKLNAWMLDQGSFTHFDDLGDAKIWDNGSSPNVAIWRFQKGLFDAPTMVSGKVGHTLNSDGMLCFPTGPKIDRCNLSDLFDVRVGACSGADEIFEHRDGIEMVSSKTAGTGKLRRMIYNERHSHLTQHKGALMKRGGKRYTEANFWEWNRPHHHTPKERIYVNNITRSKRPFFVDRCTVYDGSVMALVPKAKGADVERLSAMLNGVDWNDMSFVSGNRTMFRQGNLSRVLLPASFERFAI